jgi:hypothetical protein
VKYLREPGKRTWLAISVLGLVAMFLLTCQFGRVQAGWCDFTTTCDWSSQTVSTSTDRAKISLQPANRRVQIVVEGEGADARMLDQLLRSELASRGVFTEILERSDTEVADCPILRARARSTGVWTPLFATATTVLEFGFASYTLDVQPGTSNGLGEIPSDCSRVVPIVFNGSIESHTRFRGAISRENWLRERLESPASDVAKGLSKTQLEAH